MAAGAGPVWAVSHDRATLLRIDPRSGRVAHRIRLASESHGVAFGSGVIWVALYHQCTIVRVDPHTNTILGPPIQAGWLSDRAAGLGGWTSVGDPLGRRLPGRPAAAHRAGDRRPKRPHPGLLPQPRPPQDLVAAGDSVWVATTEPNELVRLSSSGTL